MKFLKEHYEKIVLTIFLVVFVGALLWLLTVLQQEKRLDTLFSNILKQKANYKKMDFSDKKFQSLESLEDENIWDSSKARNNSGFKEYTDLLVPFEIAFSPYIEKLIPKNSFATDDTEGQCPFTNKTLKKPDLIKPAMDEDKDRIPDDVEVANGLNPKDASDAKKDLDGDSFSNLDEYQLYSTEINNPKSRPSYGNKIYLLSINKTELPIILKMVSKAGTDKSEWMIQVVVEQWNEFQEKYENKEPWLTFGQKFKIRDVDYTVIDIKSEKKEILDDSLGDYITKEIFTLSIQRIGDKENTIVLNINEIVYDPTIKIKLSDDAIEKKEYDVIKNDIISVGSAKTGFDKFIITNIIETKEGEQYVEIKEQDGDEVYKVKKQITSVNN